MREIMSKKISMDEFSSKLDSSLKNPDEAELRFELAKFSGQQFLSLASTLDGVDPSNEKDDAFSLILRISAALTNGAGNAFRDNNPYCGAALLRQLVEVEYLMWAFENDKREFSSWLNSTKEDRHRYFSPAKLRKSSDGLFRGVDYGFHCEHGGHPTPKSALIFNSPVEFGQLQLSDMLGHIGRIFDHIFRIAEKEIRYEKLAINRKNIVARFSEWKHKDFTATLPPPPI
jgi:hypothetical protein